MTMHADEDAGFNFIAPNRQIRMVWIDDLFRVDLRILRAVIRTIRTSRFGATRSRPASSSAYIVITPT